MDSVEVGGLRIAYRRTGSGRPLVLLHGGLGDSRDWRPQLQTLSEDFTVVAWDAPGAGGSDDPPETWSLADWADALAAFVDALDLERPHVLGLSWGGGLAIQLFDRHPKVPASLSLCSAYAGWAGSLSPEEVRRRIEGAMRELAGPLDVLIENFLPTLYTMETSPEVVEERRAIMKDVHPEGSRTMLRAFAQADLRDVLPKIDVPTLLLYGKRDVRAPVATVAHGLHAAIPGSRLVVIPGVGHMTNQEAPERFDAEVRAFLRSV